MADGKSAKRFYVSGQVQGVGYRFFARSEAAKLGIYGYAENLRDGRVEIYAIGPPAALAELAAALRKGPSFASVSGVGEQDQVVDDRYAHTFSIK